jgi:GSH-dependent disulfide-bond oxidoreductase
MLGDTYTIVDMNVWLGAACSERARRGRLGQVQELEAPDRESSARPAAQRAVALKDRHEFKTEMDLVSRVTPVNTAVT